MALTKTQIAELLGESFSLRPGRSGNLQINLANLSELPDVDKCRMLAKAYDKLVEAGIEPERVSVQLSHRDQNGTFRPWPCIWISARTATTSTADLSTLAEATAAAVVKALAEAGALRLAKPATKKGEAAEPPANRPTL